jgi:hypothetical protein
MPLRDHRQLPPRNRRSREGFHALWASKISVDLNTRLLPGRYHAEPLTQAGTSLQSDGFAFEEDASEPAPSGGNGEGGVATALWAPPSPPLVAPVEFGTLDIFEIRVYDDEDLRTIVAAIELVSPANKDRSAHRHAFATKCAAYLQQGVCVVIVDIIEERRGSLHEEILRRLELDPAANGSFAGELYAVAYRTAGVGKRMRLEAWPHALSVGAALPTLPLWLTPELAVPLDLEASYVVTCSSLKMDG